MSRFKALPLCLLLLLVIKPLSVQSASTSLVISEIQTGSATSSGQEFVELYNPTTSDISVDGWVLQYKSATSALAENSWSKRATLTGVVKSHGFYLISQKIYLSTADADLSTAGLSGTGGHVRLKDQSNAVVDLVGWGTTANAAETTPVEAPATEESIERLPGRLIEDGGNSTDTDNNTEDFVIRSTPQPQSTTAVLEDPSITSPVTIEDPPVDDQPAPAPTVYAALMITELVPDPASPQTDAHNEFIELYNPNADPVNIEGYTIRAGSNFHSFYNLPDVIIAPGAYLAVYSNQSHVGLTNAGGSAQVLDPAGNIVGTTGDYGKAATGQSWSLVDGEWRWSMQATPGADNILVVPAVALKTAATPKAKTVASTTKAKATSTPKSTTKTTKAAKPKVPKATKPKTSKAKKSTTTPQTALVASANNYSGTWLLIGLAMLSIGYAIYEFRHDVRNYYHITKRYLKARGISR